MLERGARLVEILKQGQYVPLTVDRQIVLIYAGTKGFLDDLSVAKIAEYEKQLAKRRRSKLVWWTVGVAGAVLIVAVIVASFVFAPAPAVEYEAGGEGAEIEGVETFTNETLHVEEPVDYPQNPPAGGPHNPAWLNCGIYDQPQPNENAVHDLEHGTVWISYDPDLDADDVDDLADDLPQNGIMAPYPGLDAPVVVTVWGRQLELDGADDPRLALFIRTYGGGETAPEPSVTCAGGVRDPQGGGDTEDGGSGTEI